MTGPTSARLVIAAAFVVCLLAVPAVALAGTPASASAPAPAASAPPRLVALGVSAGPLNNSSFVESGRGTFFTNVEVPNGTGGYPSCVSLTSYYSSGVECFNATVDPSLNLTSYGTTGLAYTTFTDDAPCPAMRGNATSEIGFTSSTTFGSRWSAPVYLGNPVCSTPGGEDQNFSDAMEPSLTSLGNGTLVLAYAEYNVTNVSSYEPEIVPYSLGCEYTVHNRIVVTESYDNGTTWTVPHVLAETDENTSVAGRPCAVPGVPLLRPSATAIGDTVYIAWMSDPYPYGSCCLGRVNYSGTIALAVSTDGGASWANGTVPPTILLGVRRPYSDVAAYPDVLVDPSGRLFLSYATGFSSKFRCDSSFCGTVYNASLVVARSTDNGTSFNFSVVTADAGTMDPYQYFSSFLTDPLSQLAYDPVHRIVDIVYSSGQVGRYCYYYPGQAPYCDDQAQLDNVFFSSSPNGGVNWTHPVRVAPSLSETRGSPYNVLDLGSVAIDAAGTVEVTLSIANDSQCDPFTCGASQEIYVNSTDDGRQWSTPALVDDNFSYFSASTCPACNIDWMGTSTSTLAVGDQVLIAWPRLDSPNGTYSSWGSGPASVAVETSRLYTDPGIDVTFNETGLPASSVWNLTVGGFGRYGPAGTNLTISGVPSGYNLTYVGSWTNVSPGVAYAPAYTPLSPGSFSVSSVVAVRYSEEVSVTLTTIPFISSDSYYWTYYTNYIPAPLPGTYWAAVGTPFTASVLPNTPTFCYPCVNLTFVSWSGSGAGSVNSNASSITFSPLAPVTEAASFTYTGYCYPSPSSCTAYNFSQAFSESGLPAGTPWGVTVLGANGTSTTASGTGAALTVNVTSGLAPFAAWDVPAGAAGIYWIPTPSIASPVDLPTLPITIHYELGTLNGTSAPLFVRETGLPNGTAWSLQVGSQSTGATGTSATVEIAAGSTLALNASPVYSENGSGEYLGSVSITPLTVNASSTVLPAGGSTTVEGAAVATFAFLPMYLVSALATSGGNVSTPGGWVPSGGSVDLTAVASTGYHFVDWTGTGAGGVSSGTSTTVSISPHGPVTELAAFRSDFAPTWNLTIAASGFGPATPFTVILGGVAYSGVGGRTIGNLSGGPYLLDAPVVGLNGTNTTRLVEASITASAGLSGDLLDLDANITLTIAYQVQYALSVFATPGGVVVGYPSGVYWTAPGALTLTAQPDPGYAFAGWSGTVVAATVSVVVPVTGSGNETAQFLPHAAPAPAVYGLTVTESGLPALTSWSVSVGAVGASGTTPSLVLGGLNGTYVFTAPTVFGPSGVRYFSDHVNVSEDVTANRSLDVAFTPQFLMQVEGGAGGSVSPGTSWVAAGSSVTFTATPNDSSQVFLGWNGSVNSTSPSLTLTASGPIHEFATFGPASARGPGPSSAASPLGGLAIGLIVLLALLVAGALVMRAAARRRSSAPPEPWDPGVPGSGDVYPEAPFGYEPTSEPSVEESEPTDEPAAR